MNAILETVRSGGDIGKAIFLGICGISFVFAVQVVFYLTVKLFPKKKPD
jgi:hypothetical protein